MKFSPIRADRDDPVDRNQTTAVYVPSSGGAALREICRRDSSGSRVTRLLSISRPRTHVLILHSHPRLSKISEAEPPSRRARFHSPLTGTNKIHARKRNALPALARE